MPDANEFTIHIFAALAQQERKMISERTKAALGALKAKGVKLGTPSNLTKQAINNSKKVRMANALTNDNNVKATNYIKLLRKEDYSYDKIADILNNEGFKTSKGKEFYPMQVQRLANR